MGQHIYEVGHKSKKLYLIVKGEIERYKYVDLDIENTEETEDKKKLNLMNMIFSQRKKEFNKQRISLINQGPNTYFGESEMIH
jgi:hypothetical protein